MVLKKAFSYVKYSIKKWGKNYNVIERADKVMKAEKLAGVAPRHPGTQAKIDVILKERPEIKEEVKKMPDDHLFRLKDVRVDSETPPPPPESDIRGLPQSRDPHETPLFGYETPKLIPEGKCSLQQALEFIAKNNNDPKTFTSKVISEQYKMKNDDVQHIIANFRTFELHYPASKRGPSITKQAMDVLGVLKIQKPSTDKKYVQLEDKKQKTNKPVNESK